MAGLAPNSSAAPPVHRRAAANATHLVPSDHSHRDWAASCGGRTADHAADRPAWTTTSGGTPLVGRSRYVGTAGLLWRLAQWAVPRAPTAPLPVVSARGRFRRRRHRSGHLPSWPRERRRSDQTRSIAGGRFAPRAASCSSRTRWPGHAFTSHAETVAASIELKSCRRQLPRRCLWAIRAVSLTPKCLLRVSDVGSELTIAVLASCHVRSKRLPRGSAYTAVGFRRSIPWRRARMRF